MNESKLVTEALDLFNTADMDLLEVVEYLKKTYGISEERARSIAIDAEAQFMN